MPVFLASYAALGAAVADVGDLLPNALNGLIPLIGCLVLLYSAFRSTGRTLQSIFALSGVFLGFVALSGFWGLSTSNYLIARTYLWRAEMAQNNGSEWRARYLLAQESAAKAIANSGSPGLEAWRDILLAELAYSQTNFAGAKAALESFEKHQAQQFEIRRDRVAADIEQSFSRILENAEQASAAGRLDSAKRILEEGSVPTWFESAQRSTQVLRVLRSAKYRALDGDTEGALKVLTEKQIEIERVPTTCLADYFYCLGQTFLKKKDYSRAREYILNAGANGMKGPDYALAKALVLLRTQGPSDKKEIATLLNAVKYEVGTNRATVDLKRLDLVYRRLSEATTNSLEKVAFLEEALKLTDNRSDLVYERVASRVALVNTLVSTGRVEFTTLAEAAFDEGTKLLNSTEQTREIQRLRLFHAFQYGMIFKKLALRRMATDAELQRLLALGRKALLGEEALVLSGSLEPVSRLRWWLHRIDFELDTTAATISAGRTQNVDATQNLIWLKEADAIARTLDPKIFDNLSPLAEFHLVSGTLKSNKVSLIKAYAGFLASHENAVDFAAAGEELKKLGVSGLVHALPESGIGID